MQRYTYEGLEERQIRLLKLRRDPKDNHLQGSIKICNLDHPPHYEALSYSWGAETPKFEIGRHTPVFDVPRNLNTALHTIMALTDAGKCRTLWIDQICILQEPRDNEEKGKQLEMMGEIYEKANNVLVWLGNPPPHIHNAKASVEQLPSIIEKIRRGVTRVGPNFLPSVSSGLPLDDDPVWEIIVDVLFKEWYYRVWTLQEAVLAKELVVYYGANILDWDLVVMLHGTFGSAPLMPLRHLYDQKELHYKSIKSIQTYRKLQEKGKKIDWPHLLWTCGFRDCSNPLDRIFALLGMADASVKEVVKENYKADERQVFLDAFRSAIDCDHQLHILSLPFDRGDTLTFERGNPDGLPTWCPNLKKRLNGCVPLNSYFVGIRKSDEESSKVSRDKNSDYLTIQGLEMDKISQIAKCHYPGSEERDRIERPKLVSKFQEETLRMTESVYEDADKALEPYCRTLIADVPRQHNGRKWTTEEMITGYKGHFTPSVLICSSKFKREESGKQVRIAC